VANLLITDYCNRNCSYCFARSKVETDSTNDQNKRHHISMENVAITAAFMKRSKLSTATLLGGEPTLHPQFEEIVDYLFAEGFSVRVFTNGIIDEKKLAFLTGTDPERMSLIVNVNHPDESDPEQFQQTLRTLEALPDKTGLGVNFYRKDLNLGFALELTKRFNLYRYIRLGLAQPIYGVDNTYIPISEYGTISQSIVDFARECERFDVALEFDCGFTMCMFSEQQLGSLLTSGSSFSFSCPTVVDIGPDLDVWHCFPLSTIMNVKLRDFDTRDEIVAHYTRKTAFYRSIGALDECKTCKQLHRGFCAGGCLSYTLSAFNFEDTHEKHL
jgi:MoaA/NifB/PqqE/SkfB family radical SAM enzyme